MFFMEKASQRMQKIAGDAQIIILATHSPELALKWCNKALVLSENSPQFFNTVDDGLAFYQSSSQEQ